MNNFGKPLRAALLGLALLAPSTVTAQQFYCAVQSTSNWVPTEYVIEYTGGAAIVTHPWIGEPSVRQVQVGGNNNRRRLGYTISDVGAGNGQRTTMRVQLMHNVANNSLRVTFDPIEYANRFSGSGSCSLVQ